MSSSKSRYIRQSLAGMVALATTGLNLNADAGNAATESEIVRVPASRATYVTSGSPWRNYSDQERMVVGFTTNPNLQKMRGWIEFDFSPLPDDAVAEAAAIGLSRHGDDGPVNPREMLVVDQGLPSQLPGANVNWDRIGGGGDPEGTVVAVLSPGVAGSMREMTPLTTMPELQHAIAAALAREPRRLYLLLYSPEAEAQDERGHYWRLGGADEYRPVLMLQYRSSKIGGEQ
jgi:hypothetical protein